MNQKNHTEQSKKNKRIWRGTILATAVLLIAAFSVIGILEYQLDQEIKWQPDYPKIDLADYVTGQLLFSSNLEEPHLTGDVYQVLLEQTGLGKPAVDLLLKQGRDVAIKALQAYQESFFSAPQVLCKKIGPITSEERLVNDSLQMFRANKILTVEEGDVLITKATHSIGWRHGHAALVVDAEKRITLEAAIWGEDTAYQEIKKWESYPTFIQLRFVGDLEVREQAVKFAKDSMHGIPYGLLTGMIQKKKLEEEVPKTQCAHVVWYPYLAQGFDLDSDGGWLVTPKDLVNSSYFEVVQVYGVDPEELWQ